MNDADARETFQSPVVCELMSLYVLTTHVSIVCIVREAKQHSFV